MNIQLDMPEIWLMMNIMNEVCYGIPMENFEKTVGNEQSAVDLLNRIIKEENDGGLFTFNDTELQILRNSFHAVCKEIDDWEFPIRVGILKEEARAIWEKIDTPPLA
ncbi:MAG: hypothetical protein JSR76_01510 [Verrucomicrobia bacterium]|nr:hypothetical protein [Verrucomicrobiota bacterium]